MGGKRLVLMALAAALCAPALPATADPTGLLAITLQGPGDPAPHTPLVYGGRATVAGDIGLPAVRVLVTIDGVIVDNVGTTPDGLYEVALQFNTAGAHELRATIFDDLPLETFASLDIDATPSADLSVGIDAPASAASAFAAHVDVVNLGPNEATAATSSGTIAGPGSIQAASTDTGRDCAFTASTFSCPPGTMGAGSSDGVVVEIGVTGGGQITIDAAAAAAERDADPSNDGATATVLAG